ncbi:hypothetical protein N9M17_00875 [bacterium]|jgi:hypothetical protein|nr:hypothetical protein [bacterium]
MGKNKNKNRDSVSQKERQKKRDKSWKKQEIPQHHLDVELQDMVLRINQQLRCSCGIIYADILACCTSCGKPNPLNA